MTTYNLVPPTADVVSHSFIKSLEERKAIYAKSLSDPNTFWSDYAKDNFRWQKFWDDDKVCSYNYDVRKGPIDVKWLKAEKRMCATTAWINTSKLEVETKLPFSGRETMLAKKSRLRTRNFITTFAKCKLF